MTATTPLAGTSLPTATTERLARRQRALLKVFGERFITTFNSPVLFLDDQILSCPVAVRFFNKDFPYLSKQLYLEYQYRSWKGYNQDLLVRYAELITKRLDNIQVLLTSTASRMRKLLDQQGYKLDATLWPQNLDIDVPVIARQARTYWDMLLLLEEVYLLACTANYFGVLTSDQRATAEHICKKSIRTFRSVLQTEVVKLYREADRLVKEQRSAGTVDQRMADMVEEQGRDIAAFAASSDEEARHDPSDDAPGAAADPLPQEALPVPDPEVPPARKPRARRAAVHEEVVEPQPALGAA